MLSRYIMYSNSQELIESLFNRSDSGLLKWTGYG